MSTAKMSLQIIYVHPLEFWNIVLLYWTAHLLIRTFCGGTQIADRGVLKWLRCVCSPIRVMGSCANQNVFNSLITFSTRFRLTSRGSCCPRRSSRRCRGRRGYSSLTSRAPGCSAGRRTSGTTRDPSSGRVSVTRRSTTSATVSPTTYLTLWSVPKHENRSIILWFCQWAPR